MSLDASDYEVAIHYRGPDGSIIRSGTLYAIDVIRGYRPRMMSDWEMVKVHIILLSENILALTEDSFI